MCEDRLAARVADLCGRPGRRMRVAHVREPLDSEALGAIQTLSDLLFPRGYVLTFGGRLCSVPNVDEQEVVVSLSRVFGGTRKIQTFGHLHNTSVHANDRLQFP